MLKKSSKPEDTNPTGFEVEDKPTPTVGKILLLIMAGLLLFLGFKALDDISQIPAPPKQPPSCISEFIPLKSELRRRPTSYRYYQAPSACDFSEKEIQLGMDKSYAEYNMARDDFDRLQKQINELQNQITKLEKNVQNTRDQYDITLQERQAATSSGLYNKLSLTNQLGGDETQISSLKSQQQELRQDSNRARSTYQTYETQLKTAGKQLVDYYNRELAWYHFKVFVLQIIFVLPVFLLSFWLYLRHKSKNSPYTVIFTTLVGVSALLLGYVAISYLWTQFLAAILIALWEFISDIAILRTLIFYVGMFLVVIVFGGLVYMLQKKIFDPVRVHQRRLKKGVCPHCEVTLELSGTHCPNCGKRIKDTCPHCQKACFVDFPHCPSCGQSKQKHS